MSTRTTTIVVPCYNEGSRFEKGAFIEFVQKCRNVNFLFVDDGSIDKTKRVISEIHAIHPDRFLFLTFKENSGKAEAVRKGMIRAFQENSNYVGFWDADLSTPLTEIPRFLNVLDSMPHIHLVTGARIKLLGRQIERGVLRHYVGRISATLISLVLHLPCYDTQCGAKIFRCSDIMASLFRSPFYSKWLFDVEIIARLLVHSVIDPLFDPQTCIYELPLRRWTEKKGSKVRIKDYLLSLVDILRIRNDLRKKKDF